MVLKSEVLDTIWFLFSFRELESHWIDNYKRMRTPDELMDLLNKIGPLDKETILTFYYP